MYMPLKNFKEIIKVIKSDVLYPDYSKNLRISLFSFFRDIAVSMPFDKIFIKLSFLAGNPNRKLSSNQCLTA